jgi:serine/threonine-protein kinase
MARAPDLSGVALDGRYELHAIIGEGTFGRVYRGRDRRLARPVAVKVIKPWWAEDPEWARTFEREAQLLASINDPGIVQIFDVGATGEGLYYVAELVEGESLADRLGRGPLRPGEAVDLAQQIGAALAQAHARRIVHRDVKPANVLISAHGRAKLGDFGVARLAEGTSEGGGATIVGTPRYMAPEQARGGAITPATDVYALGVVLYEMLSGAPPFGGHSAVELALRHLEDPPPALPEAVPRPVADVVARALAKEPSQRYADGGEVADALARAASLTLHAVPAGVGAASPPPREMVEKRNPQARFSTPSHVGNGTRIGQPMSPRRNVNPSERRQRAALFALVLLLALGGVAAAIALTPGHVKVPRLAGLTRARAGATVRRAGLKPSFVTRYSAALRGTVVGQRPAAGARVQDGAAIRVVLSAGPAPVRVPQLVGLSTDAARTSLEPLRLAAHITPVPAPGAATGTVVRQSPSTGASLLPGASVALAVAEAPRWRPLTSFAGRAGGRSVPFRIRGRRWEIVYTMAYRGTCTFVFICSGPTARVTNSTTGATVDSFSLDAGTGKTRTVTTDPGVYAITVTPGSDDATWSIRVDDRY